LDHSWFSISLLIAALSPAWMAGPWRPGSRALGKQIGQIIRKQLLANLSQIKLHIGAARA
jgi:hypothetical protein